MRKKFLPFLLAVLLTLCLVSPKSAEASDSVVITPQWTYLFVVTNSLSINASGLASMSSHMECTDDITKVVMNNYLQRYVDGSWTTFNSWSQTTYDSGAFWSKTYYVYEGYNYRLRTYFYAYQGSTPVESTYLTTAIQSY